MDRTINHSFKIRKRYPALGNASKDCTYILTGGHCQGKRENLADRCLDPVVHVVVVATSDLKKKNRGRKP
jgi:hypothetical protein